MIYLRERNFERDERVPISWALRGVSLALLVWRTLGLGKLLPGVRWTFDDDDGCGWLWTLDEFVEFWTLWAAFGSGEAMNSARFALSDLLKKEIKKPFRKNRVFILTGALICSLMGKALFLFLILFCGFFSVVRSCFWFGSSDFDLSSRASVRTFVLKSLRLANYLKIHLKRSWWQSLLRR